MQWQPRTIFFTASVAYVLGAGVVLAIRFFERRRIQAIAGSV
jgi:hypothetical protein